MSNSVTIKAQTQNISDAVATLKKKINEIQNIVVALNRAEKQLSSYWSGGAHDDFETAFQSDINEIGKFLKEARDYQRDLEEIVKNYEENEEELVQKLSNRSYGK